MKAIICLFVGLWLVVTVVGLLWPEWLMKRFPSMTRVFGFDPEKPTPGGLIFYRIMHGFFFFFCIYVLILIFTGKVNF